ncbi:Polyketide cyclase / dehydrase and lipid transport [Quadrisphaera granulorum]|uniref:Polyketide cyclase/dehydrase/lipid transport protein n=1 Tax=Quadrisphaera granulorum TaxID=317664 RepID=A0A316A6G5_9ACTN|nr:SRPBCC family protein [Quadrisphaera granulorum]PWJ53163.1 polyketide cyclase/dehydrase/lipid transport protein [Quadrisphaera granulorum]SZE97095.1 Polyketide cyclase / dehydrase and lipid transport [Quadrisphaera granulorum]
MSPRVTASSEHTAAVPAHQLRTALADYTGARREAMPEAYSQYRVEAGGTGAGTTVGWRFQATKSRVREQLVEVTEEEDGTLVERDTRSSMVTRWTVVPSGKRSCTVTTTTTWDGASGVKGFFERTFAPLGLKRVNTELVANLERALQG